ncbi:hypothetical protein QNI16_28185 [Cytophagaceae bacterium YF14B1]|uniref:Lipocalin-like domain-containing protein n=1 Tax=Xanthocytophaga flava TaxID=3048013 RepID=A0AAE3QS96_9BACT|nr:hypothetical protein [Xanthocytophaga flavus]MDJ1484410.1 hypothetical protein [Xanthocytophaga flavus]
MHIPIQHIVWRIGKACLVWGGLLLGSSACSEKIEPEPYTYSQLLTGKTSKGWLLTSIQIVDEGTVQTGSTYQFFHPCIADDLYVFYANGERTFEAQEGASKCNAGDPNVYATGSWSVVNATATLQFPLPIFTGTTAIPFTIKELTSTSLTVEYYFFDIDASYRFIFTAQTSG